MKNRKQLSEHQAVAFSLLKVESVNGHISFCASGQDVWKKFFCLFEYSSLKDLYLNFILLSKTAK